MIKNLEGFHLSPNILMASIVMYERTKTQERKQNLKSPGLFS